MLWKDVLSGEKKKQYFKDILLFLEGEIKAGRTIFPDKKDIFNVFNFTDLQDLKVVIIGQDPYHNFNQAHGLAFSVKKCVKIPPSLMNIYNELKRTIDYFEIPEHGCLKDWANQGVFLLNSVLTVEAHKPNSHRNIGWECFTDKVIADISNIRRNIVFMLWGASARGKKHMIDSSKHCILESSHPSPLSAYKGFLGCNHFILANEYLRLHNMGTVNWSL